MHIISPRPFILCFLLVCVPASPWAQGAASAGNNWVTRNDVVWTSSGEDENDSMPIGNGDIAANVWTETNGDLVFLVAKSDALTEWGKLSKLGRGRVRPSLNPFAGATNLTQILHLENGSMEIKSGEN